MIPFHSIRKGGFFMTKKEILNAFLFFLQQSNDWKNLKKIIDKDNIESSLSNNSSIQFQLAYFFGENSEYIPYLHHFESYIKEDYNFFNASLLLQVSRDNFNQTGLKLLDKLIEHDYLSHCLYLEDIHIFQFLFRMPKNIREKYINQSDLVNFYDPYLIGVIPDIMVNKRNDLSLIEMIFSRNNSSSEYINDLMIFAKQIKKYPVIKKSFMNKNSNNVDLRHYGFLYLTWKGYFKSVNYLIEHGYKPNKEEIEIFNIIIHKYKTDTVIRDKLLEQFRPKPYAQLFSYCMNSKYGDMANYFSTLSDKEKTKMFNIIKKNQKNFNFDKLTFSEVERHYLRKKETTPFMVTAALSLNIEDINHLLNTGYPVNEEEISLITNVLLMKKEHDIKDVNFLFNYIKENISWQDYLIFLSETKKISDSSLFVIINSYHNTVFLNDILPKERSDILSEKIRNIYNNKALQSDYLLRYFLDKKLGKFNESNYKNLLDSIIYLGEIYHEEQPFIINIFSTIYNDKFNYDYLLENENNVNDFGRYCLTIVQEMQLTEIVKPDKHNINAKKSRL